ncbi:MAG: hypothetical protein WAO58_04375 [Fimbriimonadaceae bacterium]
MNRLFLALCFAMAAAVSLGQGSWDPPVEFNVSPSFKEGRTPTEFDSTITIKDEDSAQGGAKFSGTIWVNLSYVLNGTTHVTISQPGNGITKTFLHRKKIKDLPAGYYNDYYDATDTVTVLNFRDPVIQISQSIRIPGPAGGG